MTTHNFRSGVGRLVTDRYDFQNHIDGNPPHHKAGIITLDPAIVINSVSHTNVQSAITELAPFAVTVPDATSAVKGIIRLGGDIEGTADSPVCHASYILSRPLGATPPSSGDVLTWSGVSWSPDAIPIQFVANGDLQGTGLNQEVIAITGLGNNTTIKCSDLTFINTVTSPRIQHLTTTTTSGANLSISAQGSTFAAGTGGNLSLSSGFGSVGVGAVRLQLYTSSLLELAEPTSSNYILSLVKGSAVTSTEMPNGTGNRVIYVANAASTPTVSPVGGAILYANAGGLAIKQSNGDVIALNKRDVVGLYRTYTQEQDEWPRYVYQLESTANISSSENLLSFPVQEDSIVIAEFTSTGKTAAGGFYSAKKEIFTVNRSGAGAAIQVGATTVVHSQTSGISTPAGFSVSGNNIIFRTGEDTVSQTHWSCHVEITVVKPL